MVEVRSPGMHKGTAVETLAEEQKAGAFVFIGDDLGDVDAFEAVRALRADGMPALLVCSGSEEESTLVDLSDAVVHGPDGVLEFLRQLMADIDTAR